MKDNKIGETKFVKESIVGKTKYLDIPSEESHEGMRKGRMHKMEYRMEIGDD